MCFCIPNDLIATKDIQYLESNYDYLHRHYVMMHGVLYISITFILLCFDCMLSRIILPMQVQDQFGGLEQCQFSKHALIPQMIITGLMLIYGRLKNC